MKLLRLVVLIFLLFSCDDKKITEINVAEYFKNIQGTAVFFNPAGNEYKIYNVPLSRKRSSPCSTFKIISSFIALSEQIITLQNSDMKWNRKTYGYPLWNKDMNLTEAFKSSCVWYFRALIDKIPPETVEKYLQKYQYGNHDVSDWQGTLNTNTDQAELKGFWIESSLQISPVEQVNVLAKIFKGENQITETLKKIMLVETSVLKVYGKTGLGIKNNLVQDAWFIGFYERNSQKIFFAVRLADQENKIEDYRYQASRYAKSIALDIIQYAAPF